MPRSRLAPAAAALAGIVVAGSAAALLIDRRVRRAKASSPVKGRHVTVDGVRLHYVERGGGMPVVLLHGSGAQIRDFEASGLVDRLARRYRVIVFDRPGYGDSSRPRGRHFTPTAQAALFARAFEELNLHRPVVLGHSWGALVALALGLDHPDATRGLVLLSGYFYPVVQADGVLVSLTALPLAGAVVHHALTPLVVELGFERLIARLFAPRPVPARFREIPLWTILTPAQLSAAAAEVALTYAAARALSRRYGEVRLPVAILAGDGDREVDSARHSLRLAAAVPGSRLTILPGVGHMIHYAAGAEIEAAIAGIAQDATPRRS